LVCLFKELTNLQTNRVCHSPFISTPYLRKSEVHCVKGEVYCVRR